jgi:hypothetical protein
MEFDPAIRTVEGPAEATPCISIEVLQYIILPNPSYEAPDYRKNSSL